MDDKYETLDDVDVDSSDNSNPVYDSAPETLENDINNDVISDNIVDNSLGNDVPSTFNKFPNQTFNGNSYMNNQNYQNNDSNQVNCITYVKKNPINGFLVFLVVFLLITLAAVLVFYNKDKIFKSDSSSSTTTSSSSSNNDNNSGENSNIDSGSKEVKEDNKEGSTLDTSVKGLLKDACSKNLGVDQEYSETYSNGELKCLGDNCSFTDNFFNMYSMICSSGEYLEQDWNKTKADIALSTMCSVVDSNGNYVSTDNGKCENYTCYYDVEGKTYSKVCK